MKTRYYILAFILCLRSAANLQAQLTNNELSYIRSRTISSADSSQYLDRIDYFDGLGRPVQSVRKAFSPAGKDLVNLLEYDMAGREVQNWLSAESSLATGASLAPDVFKAKAQTAYGDAKPYGYTLYEPSPLNRPLAQFGPGADWHNNGKAVKTAYGTNTSTAELSCAYYTVGNNTLVKSGDYAPNQLFVTKTTDEDGAAAYEFKNKQEQLLLSRRINGAAMHDTYYVYDDYGNLAYALTPEAASLLAENGAWADGNTVMANLAYLYKYDHRNRCIAKKLPGADWTYYIYDKADRLIFSQDGERRAKGEWLFSIPDALGRPTVTGVCKNSLNYNADPLKTVAVKASRTNASDAYKGYSLSGVSLQTPLVLTVNYFDDYLFMGKNSIPAANDADFKYEALAGYGTKYAGGEKGLLTGALSAMLDGAAAPTYLYALMYYDDKGRVVQTKSNSQLPGGIEKSYAAYNFTGQPVQQLFISSAAGKPEQSQLYKFTYDHALRLSQTSLKMNSHAEVVLAQNTYDETGRLISKKMNNRADMTSAYGYNLRSWLTGVATPNKFSAALTYTYGGNISAQTSSNSGAALTYAYAYDGLGRLSSGTSASFAENGIAYDRNGNITGLTRTGGNYADAYAYTYNGNKLAALNRNGVDYPDEYVYDNNGNTVKDGMRGFSIEYNLLNLPAKIRKGGDSIEYVYSAKGEKLAKKKNGAVVNYYCGNMVYKADLTPDYVIHPEGLALYSGGAYGFQFNLTDHLGNVRTVLNASAAVQQANDYFPFGLTHATVANIAKNKYLYNGKELQNDVLGGIVFDQLDYGARFYDPVIGRWHAVDPLAEQNRGLSPFAYGGNNPVNRIDPDGMLDDWYADEKGDYHWRRSRDKEIEIGGVKYSNIGNSVSIPWGSGYRNYYQNVGYEYSEPVNMFDYIMSHESMYYDLISSGSGLWDQGKQDLFESRIHRGQRDFMNHPVTRGAIDAVTFVVGGGIEGVAAIANLGKSLFSKTAAKAGIQLSKKTFGHAFTTHGDDATNFLLNRARGSSMAQGQFLDNQKAAQFILDNLSKTTNGAVNIPIPNGFPARVIMPDGTFKVATHIRLIPGGGGVKTAYPLIIP